jgi:hypothetical protein
VDLGREAAARAAESLPLLPLLRRQLGCVPAQRAVDHLKTIIGQSARERV